VEKPTLDRFPETVEISVEALTCFARSPVSQTICSLWWIEYTKYTSDLP
jgi:hypothetical protein